MDEATFNLWTKSMMLMISYMIANFRIVWNCVTELLRRKGRTLSLELNNNNNNNNNIYLLQLGCYPVAVVILHVNKI